MKILEEVKAQVGRAVGSPGLLYEQDKRDVFDEQFGLSFGGYTPKHDTVSYFRYQYDQNPNNTCTQVGTALALSEQMSVRFSIDAITKILVKERKIKGNGFCSQQPPMGVAKNHGLIPHHIHPDLKNAHWSELSRWTKEVEQAYTQAHKMTGYKRLRNEQAVIEAIDAGYVPIVASKWTSGMNSPMPKNYFLNFGGYSIGGHQYRITGYRKQGADFENGQSFGENYGEKGKAYNETLFGSGYYEVWIVEYNGSPLLPIEVLRPLFLTQHEGLMVKAHPWLGDPKCFVIEGGKKRHVRGEDNMQTFFHLQTKVGLTHVNKVVLDSVPEGEPYPFI